MERSLPTHTLTIVCDGTDAHRALLRIHTLLDKCHATVHSLTINETGRIIARVSVDVRGSIRIPRALEATAHVQFFTIDEELPPLGAVPNDL